MENKIGYKDDPIFLLSAEEYKRYKGKIPPIRLWWWLRTKGYMHRSTSIVDDTGDIRPRGDSVDDYNCVRPAIHVDKDAYGVWDKICVGGYTWIVIDTENGIAIAEMPIGVKKFDSKLNDYETSYVRKWLLDWYKERTQYFCEDQ